MKSNLHNLSFSKKFSMDMGVLAPIGWKEVLPGDHFQHSCTALIRTQPLLAPLMHKVNAKIFHFFVPNRLLWDNWQNFITGGPDGENASVHPYVAFIPPTVVGSLSDYMGVPPIGEPGDPALNVSALPFRAYNLIFNQYFRDQDLVDPLPVLKSDGADPTLFTLQSPAWKKDYFTVARPEPMKGPEVTVPVQGSAPVTGIGKKNNVFGIATQTGVRESTGETVTYAPASFINDSEDGNTYYVEGEGGFPNIQAQLDGAFVDALDFREAFAQLRFQELRSRFGSEYVDYLAFLGVRSSDARLQRAEYLGGGVTPLQFSEVLQTAPEDSENPVGALKGHGIAAKRSNRYRRYFEEHGIMMSLMYVMPEPVYGQGVDRSFLRKTKEDYWQPEYEHIGQQPVQAQEIYAMAANREADWGWVDRYEEYRHSLNTVGGEFRTTLNYWNMYREFAEAPALNADFVTGNPTNRIFPAPTEQQLYVMVSHNLKARRFVTNKPKGYVY